MKKIVIFAGTTEGRRLSEILADAGIAHTVCAIPASARISDNLRPSVVPANITSFFTLPFLPFLPGSLFW